jgi:hypothetical protein
MAHTDPTGGAVSSFYTQLASGVADGALNELHESARRMIDFTTKNGQPDVAAKIETIRLSMAMSIKSPVRTAR